MALEQRMIEPFEPRQVAAAEPVISFGLSSYGYDVRLASDFKIVRSTEHRHRGAKSGSSSLLLDPKTVSTDSFQDVKAEALDLAAHSFVLGRTVEYLRIPADVLTICVGKSSYARCGVLVNVTPFEPGWEGNATLCIVNTGPLPVRLYANEGIAQIIFFQSDEPCEISYADRRGKYQAQREVTPARMP